MENNVRKMNKIFLFLLIIVIVLIIATCTSHVINSSNIGDFKIDVLKDQESNNNFMRISGSLIDSALWIKSYEVQYYPNKIVLKITKTLKPTGYSHPYYIQFLLPDNINFVFLGDNEIIWEKIN